MDTAVAHSGANRVLGQDRSDVGMVDTPLAARHPPDAFDQVRAGHVAENDAVDCTGNCIRNFRSIFTNQHNATASRPDARNDQICVEL